MASERKCKPRTHATVPGSAANGTSHTAGTEPRRIGLFSTVPVEVILASGAIPVDLNNLMVTASDPDGLIQIANTHGVPRTLCAWTRGILGAVVANGIHDVVAVEHGDCSANRALASLLDAMGVRVIRFHYPLGIHVGASASFLAEEMERFCNLLGTDMVAARERFQKLSNLRVLLAEVDQRLASGMFDSARARLLLLSSTDMNGDPETFARQLAHDLDGQFCRRRDDAIPVAVAGVPTVLTNLVQTIEESGATVRLFEVESDFAMIPPADDLISQYLTYAYPYGQQARLVRLARLTRERQCRGIVLFSQTNCHHNLEARRVIDGLSPLPVLQVEGDTPGPVSQRDRIRIEAFVEQLRWLEARGPGCPVRRTLGPQAPVSSPSGDTGSRLALDIGSRFTKVWFVAANGSEFRTRLDTMDFYKAYSSHSKASAVPNPVEFLRRLGLQLDQIPEAGSDLAVACTGYGRNRIHLQDSLVVPEIQAHALGASGVVPYARFLLIDIGGQDTKVMVINQGRIESFIMNDKCAAGTGRYIENMGRLLNVDLEYILSSFCEPVAITSTCATFGESEVVGHVVDGVPMESICSGVLKSVADRTMQMIGRLSRSADIPVVLSGGVASSKGLRGFLGAALKREVEPLPLAEFNGARGLLRLLEAAASNQAGQPSESSQM